MTERASLEAENRLLSDPGGFGPDDARAFPAASPRGFFWNPWVSAGSIGPFHLAQGFLSPFVALPGAAPARGVDRDRDSLPEVQLRVSRGVRLPAQPAVLGPGGGGRAPPPGPSERDRPCGACGCTRSVSVTYPLLLMAVDRAFEEPRDGPRVRFAALSILLCLSGRLPALDPLRRARRRRSTSCCGPSSIAAGRRSGRRRGWRRPRPSRWRSCVPSILATARFLAASGYGELRRGHRRLARAAAAAPAALLPARLPGHAAARRLPRDRLDPGRQLHRDGRRRRGGGGRAGVSRRSRRSRGADARRSSPRSSAPRSRFRSTRAEPLLSAVGSLPLLDISLFARAKILIVLAAAILAACGAEALERLAGRVPLRALALRTVPFLVAVPLAFLALDFYPVSPARRRRLPRDSRHRPSARGDRRGPALRRGRLDADSQRLRGARPRGRARATSCWTRGYRRLVSARGPERLRHATGRTSCSIRSRSIRARRCSICSASRSWPLRPGRRRRSAPTSRRATRRPSTRGLQPPPPPASAALRRIYDGPDMALFARERALPRFRLVASTCPAASRKSARPIARRSAPPSSCRRSSSAPLARTRAAPGRRKVAPLEIGRAIRRRNGHVRARRCWSTSQKRVRALLAHVPRRRGGRELRRRTASSSESRCRPAGTGSRGGSWCRAREVAVSACGLLALAAVMIAAGKK